MSLATEEGRRTAFKAAYLMGDQGRDVFTWLAGEDLPAARRAAVLSLYLRWRRDPRYVSELLEQHISRAVGLPPIGRRGRILRFLGDLSITIYINHPDDDDMVRWMSAMWRRVLRRQLRLNQLLFLLRGPIVGHLQAIAAVPTLRTALLAELQDPDEFFRQAPDDRDRFVRTVELVDPTAGIATEARRDDLVGLLRSGILLHRILGALVIAVHAWREPEATWQIVQELRARLDGPGLLWATLAYSVPLRDTPVSWVPQLESMTADLAEQHRGTLFGEDSELLSRFDIALLPLGIAYGKQGRGMPLFDAWLERGLHSGPGADRALAVRTIRGLAAVGVYFPHAVFESLQVCADDFRRTDTDDAVVDALVGSLAAMRSLHFDAVDLFLQQVGASDAVRRGVSMLDSPDLVSHCVRWLGYFSNAVHVALNYPVMRQSLLIAGLEALGKARRASDFTRTYTATMLHLLEQAEFDMSRWIVRDVPA